MKYTLRSRFAWFLLLAAMLSATGVAWGQEGSETTEPAAETTDQPAADEQKPAEAAPAAEAAVFKPVVVASIASHEQMIDRLRFIGAASPSDPDGATFLKSASGLIEALAKIEGLDLEQVAGIDTKRPWGMAVISDQLDMIPYVFVPVADVEKALESLRPVIGEAKPLDDGVFEIDGSKLLGLMPMGGLLAPAGVELYLKASDGWLYGVQLQEHFEKLLSPDELLDSTDAGYDASFSFYARHVPEALRSMLVDRAADIQIPGVPTTPTRSEGESEAQFAFRQQLAGLLLQFGSQVFRDAERVVMGVAVDKESQQLVGEMTCVAVADTPLARHFQDLAAVETQLGGIASSGGDEEVMAAGLTVKLDDVRREAISGVLESYRKAVADLIDNEPAVADEARAAYHELVDQWAATMQSAIDRGTIDAGLRITAAAGRRPPWTMVAGIVLPDTAPMEQLVRRLGELIEQEPGAGTVKWDVAQQGDVAIHQVTLKVPSDAGAQVKLFQKVFGGLDFHFAIAPQVAWLAVGPEGLDALKKALAGGASTSQPLRMVMRAAPFLPIFGQTLESQELAMGLTLMSTQLMAGDTVRVTINTSDNTLRLRGTADKGFMTLTGMLSQLLPSLLNRDN